MQSYLRLALLTCAWFLTTVAAPAVAESTPPPWLPSPRALPPPLNSVVNGPSATVILPSSAFAVTYSRKGIFQCVQLPQDQPAQVTVQFAPTELPPAQLVPPPLPQIVKAEAIDGGILVAGPLATIPNRQNVNVNHILSGSIQSNGTFTFTFVPAHHPGLYQVRLQRGSQIIGLQFWVADPQRPANNPPTMIAPALAINPIQPIL